MPMYDYKCLDRGKESLVVLTLKEHESTKVICPKCGSTKMQQLYSSFVAHPPNHCSFREQGGSWPIHCVAGSTGALPPPSFPIPETATVIHKATLPDKEAYSAFQDTPLHKRLQAAGIVRLFIGGLATDYCILNTVKDARVLGYHVCLLTDAIRAVDVAWEDGRKAEEAMIRLGAIPTRLESLAA